MYRLDFKLFFIFGCLKIVRWWTLKTLGRDRERERFYANKSAVKWFSAPRLKWALWRWKAPGSIVTISREALRERLM